jgi:hypothetical protein
LDVTIALYLLVGFGFDGTANGAGGGRRRRCGPEELPGCGRISIPDSRFSLAKEQLRDTNTHTEPYSGNPRCGIISRR